MRRSRSFSSGHADQTSSGMTSRVMVVGESTVMTNLTVAAPQSSSVERVIKGVVYRNTPTQCSPRPVQCFFTVYSRLLSVRPIFWQAWAPPAAQMLSVPGLSGRGLQGASMKLVCRVAVMAIAGVVVAAVPLRAAGQAPQSGAQQPTTPKPTTPLAPATTQPPTTPPDEPQKYEETVVVSASRTEEKLANAPVTMSVITAKTIQQAT